MNIQDARIRAEQETHSICATLDHDLRVKQITTFEARNIIAGIDTVNNVEEKLAKAIMNNEDIEDLKEELKDIITDYVKDYIDTCNDEEEER